MNAKTATFISMLVSIAAASHALANVEQVETLVHETTTTVTVELTEDTVLCSFADYALPELKVLIPELAALTLLDHQNLGAGAPCVAAGECAPYGDFSPEMILDSEDPADDVAIVVQATRLDWIDHDAMTCETSLIERVELEIRGTPFFHQRSASLGQRQYEDCLLSPTFPEQPNGDDLDESSEAELVAGQYGGSSDESATGQAGHASESAGCRAGGSGSVAGALLLLFGILLTPARARRS